MKLAALYNVWDGDELLLGSIKQIQDHVDTIVIIYQDVSNFGEQYHPNVEYISECIRVGVKIFVYKYNPVVGGGGFNERAKRNMAIEIARKAGCTHFFHIDVDEYYENFSVIKEAYIQADRSGSVLKLFTYFKEPTLRFENPDNYYVPFIHQLKPDTTAGSFKQYPFYVDPTRRVNEIDVIELPFFMHHFSWVRKDIMRKVRNSTARSNIDKTTLVTDYLSPDTKEGTLVRDYQNMSLVRVPNQFEIQL
jgi:hypothetical protein